MAIFIKDDPDVFLTPSELARYREEYRQAFSMFCGTPPSFNSWVASRQEQKQARTRESVYKE